MPDMTLAPRRRPLWRLFFMPVLLLVAAAGLGFSSHVLAAYYTPRVALIYPLTAAFAIIWLLGQRSGRRALQIDVLDLAAAGFVAWQLIAAAAAPVMMAGGASLRGEGAIFSAPPGGGLRSTMDVTLRACDRYSYLPCLGFAALFGAAF